MTVAEYRPIAAPSVTRRARGWRNASRVVAAIVLLATFVGCMAMYTRHNAFPYQYHPDEGGKAQQIVSDHGYRNFNHPQLMLEATQLIVDWHDGQPDFQEVVEIGRRVSATFAALGVVCLALCGYLIGGLPGLIAVTPAVALCPFLLAHTHAMKEDAALVFGVCVATLGSCLLWHWGRRPALGWVGVAVLAIGFAAATSGKYVGAATVALGVLALVFAPRRNFAVALMRPIVFVSYALLVTLLVNHRILRNWDSFDEGLDREYEHSITGHSGLTMASPNGFVFDVTRDQTFPHVAALAGLGLLLAIVWWPGLIGRVKRLVTKKTSGLPNIHADASIGANRGLGWDRCMWTFTAIFLYVLSMSLIPMERYALPIVVLVALLAGVGATRLGQFVGRPWAVWGFPAAFAIVTLAWQGARCADYVNQFGDDSRQRLREFLLTDAMNGAVVACELYTGVNAPPYHGGDDGLRNRVRLIGTFSAADQGSVDRLRRMGVTHVAVASPNYERYFNPHVFAVPGEEDDLRHRQAFYRELFHDEKLVWSREAEHPMKSYTNPLIRVYDIRK